MTKKDENIYVGIDVSKNELDIFVLPSNVSFSHKNSYQGIQAIKRKLTKFERPKVVLEATGGYEKKLTNMLNDAGFEICIVNPRQIRDFAKALGKLAKTDKIDAQVIALFAQKIQPEARKIKSKNESKLAELSTRRKQLIDMITMEKNRLDKASGRIKKSIKKIIKTLEKELAEVEEQQNEIIREDEFYSNTYNKLISVPGIGIQVATSIIAYMPELGTLSSKKIAALAGLAPFNRDSGTLHGLRTIWGGRANVRCSMYMATLVATRYNPKIKAFYQKLCNAGKAKKVALIACMRKLLICINAMVKNNQSWQECMA